MNDLKKDQVATEFSDRLYEKVEEFIDFIRNDEFAVAGTYKESWEFIKRDNHSLKGYCNFHLFFQ